jgi:DNA-binding NarL/FixJ family response regulator
MNAILLISDQPAIVEKWQTALALHHRVSLFEQPVAKDFTPYTLIILDSCFIDDQSFPLSQIKQSTAKLLIIGEHWPEESQVNALLAGAAGYCDVNTPPRIILKAVDSILQNDIWIQRHLIRKVIGVLAKPAQPLPKQPLLADTKLACLSKREQDVAQLICQGTSNKRIASTLAITERTVKAHLTSIFVKLNVTNRLHLGLLLKEVEE